MTTPRARDRFGQSLAGDGVYARARRRRQHIVAALTQFLDDFRSDEAASADDNDFHAARIAWPILLRMSLFIDQDLTHATPFASPRGLPSRSTVLNAGYPPSWPVRLQMSLRDRAVLTAEQRAMRGDWDKPVSDDTWRLRGHRHRPEDARTSQHRLTSGISDSMPRSGPTRMPGDMTWKNHVSPVQVRPSAQLFLGIPRIGHGSFVTRIANHLPTRPTRVRGRRTQSQMTTAMELPGGPFLFRRRQLSEDLREQRQCSAPSTPRTLQTHEGLRAPGRK
jgi:hypothetical protein